jgi:ADP-ribose pyrophosphatase YjhB (NUDIX family)
MENKVGIGIDIIIQRNNKILLGKVGEKWKGDEGEWGLPGNDLKFNEKFKDCVERNLNNELDMKLIKYDMISVNNNFWLGNHYINIGVLVEAKGEPKLLNKEDWSEWEWFDKDKLPEKLCPPARITLKCFLENKITVSE